MSLNRDLERIIAFLGLILILAVAVICDQFNYLFLQQVRFSTRQVNFSLIAVWVRTFGILITSLGFIFLACFIYARVSQATWIGVVFLGLGLFLAFYPEIVTYSHLNFSIMAYLVKYHGASSILYHSSGLTVAIGLLTLFNRRAITGKT